MARLLSASQAVEVRARLPEAGGWSPEVIQVEAGQPLVLRLSSDDVVHGFAVGRTDHPAVELEPGRVTDITLAFDQPGTYTFYCTRWCGPNHWRMRGLIEVTGEGPETAAAAPPPYLLLGLDIDAPHPAAHLPPGRPSAGRGRELAASLSAEQIEPFLGAEYYQAHAPAQAFLELSAKPDLGGWQVQQVWDLVAFLWWSNTTPEGVEAGRRLYAETGAGDGVFAVQPSAHTGHNPARTADFTDPAGMLGASPALLHGKIVRGGMGTGMPYWGPIFTDRQTWDLVAFLWSFQFEYDEVYP
jgi:plastocyanin